MAARLEQAAAPGEILIGEQTLELVRHAVTVEPLPPLELKGKTQRVPAFRLVDIDVVTPSTGPEFSAPLVGRDHELQQLHAAFDRAVDRRGCELLTIVGPAGIGKSRLAREFAESVHERASVAVGRCLSYGEGLTFWPLREVVTALAGDPDGASSHEVESRLLRLLQDGDETEAVVERVAGALGWSEAAADPPGTFWAVRELLAAAAVERPLVIVLEDIHWAEPIFLDLIEHLARTLDGAPVLIVALARGDLLEVRPGFGGDAPRLSLQALTGDDSRRLVEQLLADDEVAADLVERVFVRAGGNPLFVAELVRMLVEDGRLERSDAGLSAVRSSLLALPPTIHALLAARMDRLEPAERTAAEAGAVVGRSFGAGALLELIDGVDRAALDAHLEALVHKQLIEADGGRLAGEPTFSFSHVLDPRRRLPGHAQGASRRPPRAVRGLGRAHSRRAGGRARRDDRLPPGARLPLRIRARHARRARARAGCPRRPAARLVGRTCARPRRHPGRRRPARACRPAARRRRSGTARAHDQAQHRAGGDRPAHARRRPPAGARRDGPDTGERSSSSTIRPAGSAWCTSSRELRIGRLADNDLALVWDADVSRRHARITRTAKGWVLADDGSRNGSYVNGERITDQSALNDGDVLRFGDTVMLFRAQADGAVPSLRGAGRPSAGRPRRRDGRPPSPEVEHVDVFRRLDVPGRGRAPDRVERTPQRRHRGPVSSLRQRGKLRPGVTALKICGFYAIGGAAAAGHVQPTQDVFVLDFR